jgi:hypothetical protein
MDNLVRITARSGSSALTSSMNSTSKHVIHRLSPISSCTTIWDRVVIAPSALPLSPNSDTAEWRIRKGLEECTGHGGHFIGERAGRGGVSDKSSRWGSRAVL